MPRWAWPAAYPAAAAGTRWANGGGTGSPNVRGPHGPRCLSGPVAQATIRPTGATRPAPGTGCLSGPISQATIPAAIGTANAGNLAWRTGGAA